MQMLEHIFVGIKYYKITTTTKFTPKIMLEFECGLERNGKMAWLKQGCQCSCSFSFASLFFLKDSSLDRNHDGTLLLTFISAQKKKHSFLGVGLEPVCQDYCMTIKGEKSWSSWCAALVFTTRSNFICVGASFDTFAQMCHDMR